jgi:catechol 2,3-dioxygenase-like lactoylglutathione lyase family enzyme
MQLSTAMIFVKDVGSMVAFYRDALGLQVRDGASDSWAVLDAGGAALALHAIPTEIAAEIHIDVPPQARSATPIKLIFETDDLAAARTRLEALGAVLLPVRDPRRCDALDPEGNVFQIAAR